MTAEKILMPCLPNRSWTRGNVLKEAGIPVTLFGARETSHNKLNADLGMPDDPATKALFDFLDGVLKK